MQYALVLRNYKGFEVRRWLPCVLRTTVRIIGERRLSWLE